MDNHKTCIALETVRVGLLKNHPQCIPDLAQIWREMLGRIWMPEISIEEIESLYRAELAQEIPLTLIALYEGKPVGSATLELDAGIRPEVGPWLGDFVVDPKYQNQGIGRKLMEAVIHKAKALGYQQLYLFTFDPTIANYYQRFGWEIIGMDEFKSRPVTVMKRSIR